ncbi:MAG: HAMP domain-containing sensor histidine kinase [Methanomicrobiales archaeon]|nr:HAMP domain-containing sensor histidine kinase [Methanomicrobiales archaeon]
MGIKLSVRSLLSSITRHDINNQLTVILGYLEIMSDMPPGPLIEEYFRKVSTAAKRISSMIRFTKEYEDIGVSDPAWQDCRTLVETSEKQAPLGNIKVNNEFPPGTEVFADPLVFKVFYNLMDNAFRYGGKITTIRFSALFHEDDLVIVCEDDGVGVPAVDKEKIFERGFGKNTGLGLAISREILSLSGITINENGGPGQGARFEITVPKEMWRMAKNGASWQVQSGP